MSTEQIETAARALHAAINGPRGRAWDATAPKWQNAYRDQAAAVIAAIHPTVSSEAELDALADPETILKDYDGHPYQWGIDMSGSEGWLAPHDQTAITTNHLWRLKPLTVLHIGGAA